MVCSAQKMKVAVKSAKMGASSHVTNSILINAAKWLVYASTVIFVVTTSTTYPTIFVSSSLHVYLYDTSSIKLVTSTSSSLSLWL